MARSSTRPADPASFAFPGVLPQDAAALGAPAEVEIPANPEQLRTLHLDQLPGLARTLRRRLLEITSEHGGHLGPNLGVVELTIALHREFRSPQEPIIFDTGHQAYVHKMLTGRPDLDGLRREGGTSGYPDRRESAHDVVENSHASGSIAWAHGIDRARRRIGQRGVTVAVIGDGALTGGVSLEALHELAADVGSGAVVVLNDNTRSYAPTIGGLAAHLQQLRGGELPAGADLFTALGLTYLGPVDGHDHAALADVLARARSVAEDPAAGAAVVHVVTRKGAGFDRAEADALDHWHATGPFEITPPAPPAAEDPAPPAATTWTARLGEAVLEAARADERVIAISAAMVDPVGLTPMQRKMPDRVLDVGIAEQLALGTAAGLSRGGAKPLVALYSTFLNRAFDQMLLDVALHHEDVTITLDRAGITGDDGPSHHGMWDLALAAQVPGATVFAPRDGDQLARAVPAALATPGLSLVRFPKGKAPAALPAIETREGIDTLLRTGPEAADAPADPGAPDILVVSIGALGHAAVAAAREVAREHPEARIHVIDPVQALPLPTPLLKAAVRARAVVTTEDGVVERGIGAALVHELTTRATREHPAPLLRTIGVPQSFPRHAKREAILERCGMDAAGIARTLREVL